MINAEQCRLYIIRPVLNDLKLNSLIAEELLIATMAQESKGGTYIHQVHGPAVGPYQMEPLTYHSLFDECHKEYLPLLPVTRDINQMIYDWRYATRMARMFYFIRAERYGDRPLAASANVEDLWHTYKTFWNTEKGAATETQFISNYHLFTRSE